MSKMDDEWSVETPPRQFTPKRQKTDPEMKIKLTYPQQKGREDHVLHVLFLQTIMSVNNVDLRVLNKRGEALKEAAVADLTKEEFYKNHFNSKIKITNNNNEKKGKIVVIHRIRGISTERTLKQEKKVLDFLKQHSMHLSQHDWQEDEWNTKVIGFFTTVIPKVMNTEYATKVVNNEFKSLKHYTKVPTFRLQNIPLRIGKINTRVYGLEVKTEDVKNMMTVIKSNVSPGNFVPFHMRSVNQEAFEKAVKYIISKSENTWSFQINFISEGTFFKIEEKIKQAIKSKHVIYDPIQKTIKVLTSKKSFDQSREKVREGLQQWCQELDPDDIRLFDTYPEVAYLTRDDFSKSNDSYTSHSITSILSFEIEEIEVRKFTEEITAPNTETTPSDLSEPVTSDKAKAEVEQLKEEVQNYRKELEKCTLKIEGIQVMLETIIEHVSKLSSGIPPTSPRRPE